MNGVTNEVWKLIPHSNSYEASNLGRIRRPDGKILKPGLTKGYEHVGIRFLDKKYVCKVHKLVCLAFNGVKPMGAQCVRHLDDNKRNNIPNNLRWGTNLQNAQDAILNGRQICGFDHPNVKIIKIEARSIRAKYVDHMKGRRKAQNGFILCIAKDYEHLTYRSVYKAARGHYDEMG